MRKRTPQEKKKLSLERDRRNSYGEPPHAARRIIPLRKKLRNRANRHRQEARLPVGPAQLDTDQADEIESSMVAKAPKRWKKEPDAVLRDVIAHNQQQRAETYGRRARKRSRRADRSQIGSATSRPPGLRNLNPRVRSHYQDSFR